MLDVHLHLLACSQPPKAEGDMAAGANRLTTYAPPAADSLFGVSLEEAAARLGAFPRLYFEWDGSFLWSGAEPDGPWQLDGQIYDRQERIQRVELHGRLPSRHWQPLLAVFGWPQTSLLAQLLDQQHLIDAGAFPQIARPPRSTEEAE